MGLLSGIFATDGFAKGSVAVKRSAEPRPSSKAYAENLIPDLMQLGHSGDDPAEEHPGGGFLGYHELAMWAQSSMVAPFVDLRTGQWAAHATRRTDRYSVGAEIRLKDPKQASTKASRQVVEDAWKVLNRFRPFHRSIAGMGRDSFRYDQYNAEVIMTRGGKPYGLEPADAATIRLAKPTDAEIALGRVNPHTRGCVQLREGRKVKEWPAERMLWGVRRPRTDQMVQGIDGYGMPEVAEALDVINDIIYAKNYNSSYFRNGVHASTLLVFKALMAPEQATSFHRQFMGKLKGAQQAHRLALMVVNPGGEGRVEEKIEKIDLAFKNKDMEFQSYFGFLFRLLAACFGIDLAEVGLGDPADTKPSTLSERGPLEAVLMSKERGLRPSLRSLEGTLNEYVIEKIDEDFEIRFLGMDATTPEALAKLRQQEVNGGWRTINDIRREDDVPPFNHPAADLPMNTSFIQLWQAMQAMEPAGDDGEEEAGPGQGPQPPPQQGSPGQDPDYADPAHWTNDVAGLVAKAWGNGIVSNASSYRRQKRYGLVPSRYGAGRGFELLERPAS